MMKKADTQRNKRLWTISEGEPDDIISSRYQGAYDREFTFERPLGKSLQYSTKAIATL